MIRQSSHRTAVLAAAATVVLVHGARAGESSRVRIEPIPGQAEVGTIEIHGVGASAFDPAMWEAGRFHVLPDVRSPLLSPRLSGVFRNIYAPSAVQVPDGWRVFYGAWDGVATGNDRIYSVHTADFLDFHDRRMEIDHGTFIHVCNVNALRLADGSFRMVCTVYPDAQGRNKPAFFSSPDGRTWNGTPAPHPARSADIIDIRGYAPYRDADINGVNVLLHEDGRYRLYFCNWREPGHVHRATGTDGRRYDYEGPCLKSPHAVNDVKKFTAGGAAWYLMGLHANGDRLWYALSKDGMRFDADRELAACLGAQDRYIVAHGWVVDGQRLLGFLYGAGAVPELNRNRIYARWLQKRVVITDAAGVRHEASGALGPDRQVISFKTGGEFEGRWQLLEDDGRTPIGPPVAMTVVPGGVYRVRIAR